MLHNKEFIGKEYENEIQKESILKCYDKYQRRKLEFLNEAYDNISTKKTYWNTYINNLHDVEKAMGTDIMNMSSNEILGMVDSCVSTMRGTKNTMLTFCNKYCQWCVSKQYIFINPCTGAKQTSKESKGLIASKIYNYDEFFQLCRKMLTESPIQDILPLILARYGICGKGANLLINLRWSDIDFENKFAIVYSEVTDEEMFFMLDDECIDWLNTAYMQRESEYVIEGIGGMPIKYNTLQNNINKACKKVGEDRMSFSNLVLTRQLEMLINIRQYRKLTVLDFINMVELYLEMKRDIDEEKTYFALSNKAYVIVKRYEAIFGEKVLSRDIFANNNLSELDDVNSYEVAKEKAEKYGLKLY